MMGISEENGVKKGPWTPEEDAKLVDCIQKHGHGNWKVLPKLAGLNRCGKSCRLRWTNYLRPDIKRGPFSDEEESLIIDLHAKLGNKWSAIASYLPGRTDNEIKNLWNTHLKKRLLQNGIDPITHMPTTQLDSFLPILPQFLATSSRNPTWENVARIQTDAAKLAKILLVSNILQLFNTGGNNYPPLPMEASNPSTSASAQIIGSQPGFNNDAFQPIFPNTHHKNAIETDVFTGNNEGNTMVDHRLPDLVPASRSRLSTYDQTQDKVFPTDFSNPVSTSTTFEALGDLMDDEASNYDWKQILDQAGMLP